METIITNTHDESDYLAPNQSGVDFPSISEKQLAYKDIKEGLTKWRIWFMLAYQDVKLRYRRSVLGPFWLTLSMAITVYSMGYLYSHLFHTDLKTYFPYLVGGMLSWTLISTVIIELTDAFSTSDSLIKQIKLPYSLYIHRVIARNIIIFFHNIIVIVPIIIIYHETAKVNLNTLLVFTSLGLIYVNSFAYGLILALIGGRYRDVSQIIKSLVQVAFFVTPVMWNPNVLPEKDRYIAYLNPFYSFVDLIRAPLMGMQPEITSYAMVTATSVIGIAVCLAMFARYRSRIVYWL
jgi:lipopolysaccharide transport system permease protein